LSIEKLGELAVRATQNILQKQCKVTFSQDPDVTELEIIEYNSRMRVFGMEKFNGPCFIAVINFFRNNGSSENKITCGSLIIYIDEMCTTTILKAISGGSFDEDDAEVVMQYTGELCNIIADELKNELTKIGYSDLLISKPINYQNDIPEGVDFEFREAKYHESSYYIKEKKAIVVNFSLGSA